MAVKRIAVKDKKIRLLMKKGGRKNAKKVFVALLRHAVSPKS
jgi:hypothetical protein